MDDPRPYLCIQCGMCLGWIWRDSSRVVRLNVYRIPRRGAPDAFPNPDDCIDRAVLWAVERMNDGEIRCAACGNERTWSASQAALDEMLSRRALRRSVGGLA